MRMQVKSSEYIIENIGKIKNSPGLNPTMKSMSGKIIDVELRGEYYDCGRWLWHKSWLMKVSKITLNTRRMY